MSQPANAENDVYVEFGVQLMQGSSSRSTTTAVSYTHLTLIERLFLGGSKSFPAFPLRVVYMSVEPVEEDMAAASILISVPKKPHVPDVSPNYALPHV